ncbi:O-antigen ligase family protein [Halovivax limisalsi]|uniref:O-antigen ligase family protein n=1 Tax=Halovivax limisalsi TaxID=1453760 RepID=UPI001FFDDA3C|nr:O-antigen ligase family protein [Halovivax limisalsi]
MAWIGDTADARPASFAGLALACALFVCYPFHAVVREGSLVINLSFGDPVVALIGVLWLLGAVGSHTLPRYAAVAGGLVVAAVGSLIAVSFADPAYFTAAGGALALAKLLGAIAWLIAVYALYSEFGIRVLRAALVVSVAVATLVSVWSLLRTFFLIDGFDRASGPFENPNLFGNYLVLHAFVSLSFLRTWWDERPRREVVALAIVLLSIALVSTGSRGSILGLLGGLAAVAACAVGTRRSVTLTRRSVGAAVGAAFTAVAVPAIFAPSVVGRFVGSRNVDIRLRLWEASLEALLSNPILGIGYGQIHTYLAATIGEYRGTHNVYLLVGGETGFVGLLILFGLIALVARDAIRLGRREGASLFLLGAFVAMLVQGFVTDVDTFRSFWILLGILAAERSHALGGGAIEPGVDWRGEGRVREAARPTRRGGDR